MKIIFYAIDYVVLSSSSEHLAEARARQDAEVEKTSLSFRFNLIIILEHNSDAFTSTKKVK